MEYDSVKFQSQELVEEIDQYLKRLFPINRSITGSGNRETLQILQEIAPLQIKEYPSGIPVYDWTIPSEWKIHDAWIKDADGNKLIDFQQSNIHLVSYSEAIHKKITFKELKKHLYTHPELEDAIPYRTTYYKRDWGFCATHAQYEAIETAQEPLEVCIDSDFNSQGSLSIGELLIPGESEKEILISTYICHPSLANDNLSGAVMTAFLAREVLNRKKSKYSYRFIWVPETVGSIAYCAMNQNAMKKIDIGMVITTVGGAGKYGYKQSYEENSFINLAIEKVFEKRYIDFISYPFDPHGSDERQYSSQGFRMNVASITKDKYYEYPYYHTSLDNLEYVKAEQIHSSMDIYLDVLNLLDKEVLYRNKYSNCEVMLSKHGLYPKVGGGQIPSTDKKQYTELDLTLWLLLLCDGNTWVMQIERKLGISKEKLMPIINKLCEKGILEAVL